MMLQMSQELPTPEDVQLDLQRIVHNLERFWNLRLDAFAALPTIRAWRPLADASDIESEAERRARAIEELIERLIPQQPYKEDRDSLAALFTFDAPTKKVKERHADAAKARGLDGKDPTEAFRVSHEANVLAKLATDIYRDALAWCMRQIDMGRISGETLPRSTWWSYSEIDRMVVIEESAPKTEIWEVRSILRCLVPVAQPVLSMTLQWTGEHDPIDPSEVEVLSGTNS
jgi:hypothetical protein